MDEEDVAPRKPKRGVNWTTVNVYSNANVRKLYHASLEAFEEAEGELTPGFLRLRERLYDVLKEIIARTQDVDLTKNKITCVLRVPRVDVAVSPISKPSSAVRNRGLELPDEPEEEEEEELIMRPRKTTRRK